MGLFNQTTKKPTGPYSNEGFNNIYDMLFCDDLELYKKQVGSPRVYPWDVLLADKADKIQLQELINNPEVETRSKILAGNLLLQSGLTVTQKEIAGVLIEVGMENGLDILAAYKDGTARYINHSEKIIVWETKTAVSSALIDNWFTASRQVVNQIGPWGQPRRPFPAKNMVRLSFLVSDGLYFGEGPFDVLARDAMGGPVINAATALMTFLINQQQ